MKKKLPVHFVETGPVTVLVVRHLPGRTADVLQLEHTGHQMADQPARTAPSSVRPSMNSKGSPAAARAKRRNLPGQNGVSSASSRRRQMAHAPGKEA